MQWWSACVCGSGCQLCTGTYVLIEIFHQYNIVVFTAISNFNDTTTAAVRYQVAGVRDRSIHRHEALSEHDGLLVLFVEPGSAVLVSAGALQGGHRHSALATAHDLLHTILPRPGMYMHYSLCNCVQGMYVSYLCYLFVVILGLHVLGAYRSVEPNTEARLAPYIHRGLHCMCAAVRQSEQQMLAENTLGVSEGDRFLHHHQY